MARKGRGFVVNLDETGGVGTHWTAARLLEGTLYYADPFGTILNGWPPRELAEMPEVARVCANRIAFQRPSTVLCGYYAICFALALDCIDRPLSREQLERVLYASVVA